MKQRRAKKTLIAYEKNNQDQPVDWNRHKADFKEIKELIKTPGRRLTHEMPSNVFGKRMKLSEPRNRYKIVPDEYTTSDGKKDYAPFFPYKTLLEMLRNEWEQVNICVTQFEEIKNGWGNIQETRIIKDSLFDKNELQAVIQLPKSPYLQKDHPYYCPELAALVNTWMAFYHDQSAELIKSETPAETFREWIKNNCPDVVAKKTNLEGKDAYLLKILNHDNRRKQLEKSTFS